MSFPEGKPSLYGRSHTRSICRVHNVHVERYGESCGSIRAESDALLHDRAHTLFVNVAHGEDMNAGAFDGPPLASVHVSHADQNAAAGADFRGEAINPGQSLWSHAEQCGKRHSVHVSARTCFR